MTGSLANRLTQWIRTLKASPLPGSRLERGRRSERLAAAFLRHQGFVVEGTNVRFPVGELDIVAWEGSTLCFIEVRSVSTARFGSAAESITFRKQRHLIRAAQWYLARQRLRPAAIRFDVVGVEWQNARPQLGLIRNAFQVDGLVPY